MREYAQLAFGWRGGDPWDSLFGFQPHCPPPYGVGIDWLNLGCHPHLSFSDRMPNCWFNDVNVRCTYPEPALPPRHPKPTAHVFTPLPVPRPPAAPPPHVDHVNRYDELFPAPAPLPVPQHAVPPTVTTNAYAEPPPAPQQEHYAMTLSFSSYWLLIPLAIIAALYGGHLIELFALHSNKTREAIEQQKENATKERDDRRRRAEWQRYSKMGRKAFDAELRRRDAAIDHLTERCTRLHDEAERMEAGRFHIAWVVRHLRNRADRHYAAANTALDELNRIRQLKIDIDSARETQLRDREVADARYLLKLILAASETAAKSALDKLRAIRNRIEWTNLIPADLDVAIRTRAAKLLQSAAGTDSLNESRTALGMLRKHLEDNGCDWNRVVT